MRIHFIIHAPFEKPGAIETWACKNGHVMTSTHLYDGEQLPAISEIDFLVIMGGPQSPLELDKYPYLRDEIAFAKLAIQQEKPVIGFCLGAQIIGESLGAKTERSPHKEVGRFPIQLTNASASDPIFSKLPTTFDVMHWHNDMPGVTADSAILAVSEGCPRQIVRYNKRTYGLQCHMEMTTEIIKGMIEHCADDLKPSKYVQDEEAMLSNDTSEINEKLFFILDQLAVSIAEQAERCN